MENVLYFFIIWECRIIQWRKFFSYDSIFFYKIKLSDHKILEILWITFNSLIIFFLSYELFQNERTEINFTKIHIKYNKISNWYSKVTPLWPHDPTAIARHRSPLRPHSHRMRPHVPDRPLSSQPLATWQPTQPSRDLVANPLRPYLRTQVCPCLRVCSRPWALCPHLPTNPLRALNSSTTLMHPSYGNHFVKQFACFLPGWLCSCQTAFFWAIWLI